MNKIESLLAAVDFSEDSRNAVSRAFLLAMELTARLKLFHVVSESYLPIINELIQPRNDQSTSLIGRAEDLLSEISAEFDPDGRVKAYLAVSSGSVLEEIIAASESADILVLGAHGWNPLRDIILGTTADRLLRKGNRPILIVKRTALEPYRRVIVPVDFTPRSAIALKAAIRIAPNAEVNIVHAYDVPLERALWLADVPEEKINDYRNEARQKALDNVVILCKEFGLEQKRMHHYLETGDAASVILRREVSSGADLIVVGRHRRTYTEELFLGSVTRHVLSGAKCDVLVIHE